MPVRGGTRGTRGRKALGETLELRQMLQAREMLQVREML